MEQFSIGNVAIDRVQEWQGYAAPAEIFFPEAPRSAWEEDPQGLAPDHWEAETGLFAATMQTWVVRSAGRTILIDTGIGNGKDRDNPGFSNLATGWLADLDALGVKPEDVDVVINTHLHVDHVGWNTTKVDGEWRPTFPNATYLMPAADLEFWHPTSTAPRKGVGINDNVFEDSIQPVLDAGLVTAWSGEHVIDENLTLRSTPGHTPGNSMVMVSSAGESAAFVGDMAHSPIQLTHPDLCTCYCEDPEQAAKVRRSTLSWAAQNNAVLFPGHFGASHAVEVKETGSGFAVSTWVDLTTPRNGDKA